MQPEGLSEEELQMLSTPSAVRSDGATKRTVAVEHERDVVSSGLVQLHRDFAEALTMVFSETSNSVTEVRLHDEAKGTYAQFVFGQTNPTCCAVVRARSTELEFYVAIQSSILYPLIDRMLGSKESEAIPQRPITEIERGLATLIIESVLAKYEDAWRPVLSFDFALDCIENNLNQRRALRGSEETYRVRYGVRFDGNAGFVEICLPWHATRQVRQRLAAKPELQI